MSSHENTKITTNCWTTTDEKKPLETTKKKDTLHPETKTKPQWDSRRGATAIKSPYSPGGQPTNWKIIILRRFSHRNEIYGPRIRLLSLGIWSWEDKAQSTGLWKPMGFNYRNPTELGEIQTSLVRSVQKISCAPGHKAKAEAWARPTCWGSPGGSDGKESACNAGDLGLIPGWGRSPGEGNGNSLQYSCLVNSMDWGAWHFTVHGITKSWTRLRD